MGGLFSKKDGAPGAAGQQRGATGAQRASRPEMSVKDRALLDLKVARDRLDKARKKHEREKQVYVDKAREMLKAKKKDQAKLALRLKKMREMQLEKVNDQFFNLEKMVNDVQWAQHQVEIVEGMKAGNKALKELQLDPDEVNDIVADTQEAMDRQREIDDILSEQLNPEDEADVLAELDAIEQADANELNDKLPVAPSDPVHPSGVNVETTQQQQQQQQTSQSAAEPVSEERQPVLA
ncbi:Charged multivesicular body protein 6 [Hondaea fermentalgiana]|uniref:Charged multivesicular body protein 6 n=1 Tax=Hondaea fermentalgiana TaxID=2315210 RepID=A0A2R5GN99_9STRA|nr:Charged multivesicular body protein 6 [Hondaea fermentalgiana]|eukprot:GBG31218.1 Charged multivesicular body protein 6 [Hondaea fermentalgiana]